MKFCPECGKELFTQKFCAECGADISKYTNGGGSNTGSLDTFDFSALQNANEQLIEQSGLVIENGVLTGYTGKKTSVYIPSSVEEIFDRAFYSNGFITDVEIADGATVIGKSAFANCRYLKGIKIPKSVKQIGEHAFYGTQLNQLILNEYNESILRSCLSANALKYLDTGADIKPVIKEENGSKVINIKELEGQAIAYFNECKRKEEEERRKQQEEARRKYELLRADIGKIWTFGSYYINSDRCKEPIEWIVVDRQEGGAMLVSKYAIALKKYNEKDESCYWENCTLRKWLINDFFNEVFSSSEKERMLTIKEASEKFHNFNNSFGDKHYTHSDKIFLLVENEVSKLKENEQRQCKTTPYAVRSYYKSNASLAKYATDYNQYSICSWWLESSAYRSLKGNWYEAQIVFHDGRTKEFLGDSFRSSVTSADGVRPVIWINV